MKEPSYITSSYDNVEPEFIFLWKKSLNFMVIFSIFQCLRAFTTENSILCYFTISKSYFINYTIPFYNTPNNPNYIFFASLFKYSFLTISLSPPNNHNNTVNTLSPPIYPSTTTGSSNQKQNRATHTTPCWFSIATTTPRWFPPHRTAISKPQPIWPMPNKTHHLNHTAKETLAKITHASKESHHWSAMISTTNPLDLHPQTQQIPTNARPTTTTRFNTTKHSI